MKVEAWLKVAEAKLKKVGIGSAHLDALILLEDELSKDRTWLLAHPESPLQGSALQGLAKKLERRAKHEPLAYIRGFTEFYGRRFKVNKHVLEPRPESETMIDLLKTLCYKGKPCSSWRVADVGTGSGCLGITAALELHTQNVDLFDIDAGALAVAKHNCKLHELHLKIQKRDLLHNTHTHYGVILANLPYIPGHWKIHRSIAMEPKIAFLGGKEGLDVYRRLFEQLSHFSRRPRYVLTEALPPQHPKLRSIAETAGFRQIEAQDFIQIFQARF